MATAHYRAMVARDDVDFELRDIDEQILDILEEGRCTRKHLADILGVSSEYIYQRVDLMAKLGLIDIIHDGFYQLNDDVNDASDIDMNHEEPSVERTAERPEPANTNVAEPAGDVESVVEEAVEIFSDSWDDTDDRLAARRAAARAVLQEAIDSSGPVGMSHAVEEFYDDYGVPGQNEETWWRKNIRGLLKEVGTYSRGKHGYHVDEKDVREFVDT